MASPPTLDGKVAEGEYRDAIHFKGLVDAQTGAVAAEGGDFCLGYDEQFIYFAARLADRQPRAIQSTEYRTNVSLRGDDSVTLSLDTFGNLGDFNQFTMNSRGATNIQIAGGRAAKREWLGAIESKGRVTAEGWEVEARIPWSIMRLPGKGPHDLRFNVFRDHRRLLRTFAWVQTWNGHVENNGRWRSVDVPAAKLPAVQALPYFYGGADEKTGLVANAGLDLRYPLTHDLDFVGTINPDFRNVERGILSLDFSYFERLADETRPFFLEGGRFFGSGGDFGAASIFNSQRIGNFDAGAKVFGKLDPKTDIGVLATADLGNNDAVVARMYRQLGSRRGWSAQYAGGGTNGERNDAVLGSYGVGYGKWDFSGQVAATHDSEVGDGHNAFLTGNWSQNQTFAYGSYTETTRNFLPRLGFAPETDLRGFDTYFGHTVTLQHGPFLNYNVQGGVTYQRSYDLEKSFHEGASIGPRLVWRDGTRIGTNVSWNRFFGGTDDQRYSIYLDRPLNNPFRHWYLNGTTGEVAGSAYRNLGAGVAYRPVKSLQLNGSFQRTTYLGDTLDQTIVSANYDLDQYHSIGGRTVVSPDGTNWYLSFRQAGNRGAEYYLILGDPNATEFRSSVILKAVFPFALKT